MSSELIVWFKMGEIQHVVVVVGKSGENPQTAQEGREENSRKPASVFPSAITYMLRTLLLLVCLACASAFQLNVAAPTTRAAVTTSAAAPVMQVAA